MPPCPRPAVFQGNQRPLQIPQTRRHEVCSERLSAGSSLLEAKTRSASRKKRPRASHTRPAAYPFWFESAAVRAMGFIRCSGSHPPFRDYRQTIRPNRHEANRSCSEPPSRSQRSKLFPTQLAKTDQITTNPWFYLPTDMQAFHRFQFYLATERLARGGGNHWQTIMEEARQAGLVAPYERSSQITDEGLTWLYQAISLGWLPPPPGRIAKALQAINIAMRPNPVCRRPPPPSAVLSGHTEPIDVSPVRHVPDEFHALRHLHQDPGHPAASHIRQAQLRRDSLSPPHADPARGPSPETHPEATTSIQYTRAATRTPSQSSDPRPLPQPSWALVHRAASRQRSPPQTPMGPLQPRDTVAQTHPAPAVPTTDMPQTFFISSSRGSTPDFSSQTTTETQIESVLSEYNTEDQANRGIGSRPAKH